MPRRCPIYYLTRADLQLLIEAGKSCREAAEITGYQMISLYHIAKDFGLRFRKGDYRPPKFKQTRSRYYVSGRRGGA